jgi:tRNA(Ile)-lysidine synthase
MLSPGDRVIAAVSGGPDSVCLLDVLHELAPAVDATLAGLAHLNHNLRGEASRDDERFVAALAQRYGLEFYREEANLSEGNLEESARQARRAFFARLIRIGAATRIATGHTLDDQAETVLFRLLRGSGPGGLSGILPITAEGLIRPLLEVTRADVEEHLRSKGLSWRQDATNLDARFSRNRLRQELLPLLRREWNPRISEALARYAEIAHEEERWWEAEIGRVAANVLEHADSGIAFEAKSIAELPKAMARRLIRHAFRQVRCAEAPPDFEHVERVLDLAEGHPGEGKLEFDGLEVIRSFDRLRLQRAGGQIHTADTPVSIPGRYPFGNALVYFELADALREPLDCVSLKLQGLGELPPLELRSWRVGDRYHPVGKSRDYTLHELFQRAQVPSWQRHVWPIVAIGSRIVWVRKFGVASEFAAESGTGPVLRIWEENVPSG